uniref:Uncharacterized protein n=1 Tax=Ananas comosus var. bracteatus TaxID=296719 RepID=A0A6V7NHD9_ANACO|nr:unnamed protein product [Ananas comosus var. bracteatus]
MREKRSRTLDLDLGKEIRTLNLLLGFQTFKSVLQEEIRTFSVTHWIFANCDVRVFELCSKFFQIFWRVVDSVPTYGSHPENRDLKLSTKISKVKILGCSRVGLCRAEYGTALTWYRNWRCYRYSIGLVPIPSVFFCEPEAGVCADCCLVPRRRRGRFPLHFPWFLPSFCLNLVVYSPLLLSFGILGTFPPWEKAGSLKKSLLEERSSTLAHSKP